MRTETLAALALLATSLRACVLGPPPPPLVIDCASAPEAELRYPDECTDAGALDDAAVDAGP